jgi:hypothetical protein
VGLSLCDVARSTADLSAVGMFREIAAVCPVLFVVAVGKHFCSHLFPRWNCQRTETQLCNDT